MIFKYLKNSSMMRRQTEGVPPNYLLILAIGSVFILFSLLFTPEFLKFSNLLQIVNQTVITAIVSCGIAFIMAAGDFDLSIGAVVAVANMLCALILHTLGNIPLAVVATLIAGTAMGMINGYLIGIKRLPSFYVTIATQIGFEGIAYTIGNGTYIYRSSQMQPLINGRFLRLPLSVWIAVILMLLLQFGMNNTLWGRYLLAVGHKHSIARAAGINVKKVVFLNYMVVGGIAAVGGIIYTAKVGYGYPDAAGVYAYDAIVANLIGGNRFSGGKSSVFRAFLGAIIWTILQTYMGYINLPVFYQRIVKCLIIILALLRDRNIQNHTLN